MEGITLDMMDMIQAMRRAGVEVQSVRILGGPTRSELWNQIQADIYATSVQTLKVPDATVLGAAILGGAGAGIFKSIEEGADRMVRVGRTYEPQKQNLTVYAGLYATYCRMYEALEKSGTFEAIAANQA
jgi:xylulokinase